MVCRPTGTATIGPAGWPSSCTVVFGGSASSLICASVSVATLIVDAGNDASPALATSTVIPATRVRCSARKGNGSTADPIRQTSSVYSPGDRSRPGSKPRRRRVVRVGSGRAYDRASTDAVAPRVAAAAGSAVRSDNHQTRCGPMPRSGRTSCGYHAKVMCPGSP